MSKPRVMPRRFSVPLVPESAPKDTMISVELMDDAVRIRAYVKAYAIVDVPVRELSAVSDETAALKLGRAAQEAAQLLTEQLRSLVP